MCHFVNFWFRVFNEIVQSSALPTVHFKPTQNLQDRSCQSCPKPFGLLQPLSGQSCFWNSLWIPVSWQWGWKKRTWRPRSEQVLIIVPMNMFLPLLLRCRLGLTCKTSGGDNVALSAGLRQEQGWWLQRLHFQLEPLLLLQPEGSRLRRWLGWWVFFFQSPNRPGLDDSWDQGAAGGYRGPGLGDHKEGTGRRLRCHQTVATSELEHFLFLHT